MIIAVNTRLLLKNKLEGIGWFSFETLKRITQQHPEHTFYFIFDRKYEQEFIFSDNVKPVVLSPQARHPVLFVIWFEFSVRRFLNKIKPDIFLSPDGYLSLTSKIPQISVIHDINFEKYPHDFPWIIKKYYRWFFPRFAKKALRIATVSDFSKNDIATTYNIDKNKISVVFNGVNTKFKPISEIEQREVKLQYTNGEDYFIFVGALIPRKNLSNLFYAFNIYKNKTKSNNKLLIVGEKKWWTKNIQKAYSENNFQSDIIFSGRLQPDDLHKVMSSAVALMYISYFEGFGIPILEAFSCGTAVITSNITSMPEVAGDAAILVDPFSIENIAEAMIKINSDTDFRNLLIEKGFLQKDKFSWDITADKLWKTITEV